jgi:glyoxylase-like metal-dependent hydrolase (beta-lactamase superfamily II)
MDLLVPGVYAQLAHVPGHGATNAAAIVDADGVTVVDTLMVPSQYEPFAAEVEALGAPIRRVVLTSSNIEFSGGTRAFRLAAVYGRPQASAHLDQPADVELFRRLHPEHAAELREPEDGEAPLTRSVSHVIDAPVQLTPALAVLPVTGQQEENLIAVLPGSGVILAGAMASFGVTPNASQGDPARWADSLDELLELGPIVVPGHGPIGGEEEVRDLQAYLRAVAAAEGDVAKLGDGPWTRWSARAWDVVNVERAALLAQGRDEPPPTLLHRLGLR